MDGWGEGRGRDLEMDVWMTYGSYEFYCGRGERVGGGDLDGEVPETGYVWGGGLVSISWFSLVERVLRLWESNRFTFVCGPGNTFHDGFPVQEVCFGDGVEGLEDGGGF